MGDPARTLTDEDVEAIAEAVLVKLESRATVQRKPRPVATVTADQQKRARAALERRGIIPRRVR
jgi:hypothetical protein